MSELYEPELDIHLDLRLVRKTGIYETREELKENVLRLKGEGKLYKEIREIVGVSEGTISRIINGDPDTYERTANEKDTVEEKTVRKSSLEKLNSLWRRPNV